MSSNPTKLPKSEDIDLRRFHRFRGILRNGDLEMPCRFKARIQTSGAVELDIHAFRVTPASLRFMESWFAEDRVAHNFALRGVTANGLQFESDHLTFSTHGHWSKRNSSCFKPLGECGKARFLSARESQAKEATLKLWIKGFECYPHLQAKCSLGMVDIVGQAELREVDSVSGFIMITGADQVGEGWRKEAHRLADYLRQLLSFASGTMLQGPLVEFWHGRIYEVEVVSRPKQHTSGMRVIHKLEQQPFLDAAVKSFSNQSLELGRFHLAIAWFTMDTTYTEVWLVNAMTALENLIDTNLTEQETLIEPKGRFEKTRKALRRCLDNWASDDPAVTRDELCERLLDLNRRAFRHKLYLLANRWQVSLDGISKEQIQQAIRARNAIVHTGNYPSTPGCFKLWDSMMVVRELVVRFLLTAICFRGNYISPIAGFRPTHFPPYKTTPQQEEINALTSESNPRTG